MKKPAYPPLAQHWQLDKDIVFLNHGSFGACPTAVLQKQDDYRKQMEAEPVRFMLREVEDLLWKSKDALATFTGAKAEDLIFVNNATVGVNTILNSLTFNEGDELLTHNHAYGACVNAMQWFANRAKAKVVIAEVPFPIQTAEEVTAAIMSKVTDRTRLVMIDHITSATGIIFPVEEIVKALNEKGIDTLVDGAHGPGMLDLNIDKIGATYYTGNCHKWICSPKGSAFLHVRKDRQHLIRPMVIGHHYDKAVGGKLWSSHFFWPGTMDFSAYLAIKDAIEFMGTLFPGGWVALREHNRTLNLKARKHFAEKLNLKLPAPESMIGTLSTIQISDKATLPPFSFNYSDPLQDKLLNEYGIEIPVITWHKNNPRTWLRFSAQVYNSMEQYDYLAEVVKEINI